jgi:predicted nucleic acid-binding protein
VSSESNTQKPKVFLDASALFAGVFSSAGGARMLLKLAEGNMIDLLISSQVLAEVEGALRRKAPEALGHLALLLDRAGVRVLPNPPLAQVEDWAEVVPYLPDAAVLAAAAIEEVDYLVTLDRAHLLGNERLPTQVPPLVGTPGDCLAWYRARLSAAAAAND